MSASSAPASLRLYRLATGLAEPLAPLVLSARARKGKESPARMGERLGRASQPRPEGPLVWLHGASVGEGLSLLPLVDRIGAERPDLRILVTSGTRTSAELLGKRLPQQVIHQYVPIDTPAAVDRFLSHWRPDLALFVESELWPNLILDSHRRGVRLALVSARMTEASARGWARQPAAARAVLGAFDAVLAQDGVIEARIAALGGRVTGWLNLKRSGSALGADAVELAALKSAIGDRPVIFAASTHPDEEALIAGAVTSAPKAPLLIIAPRHPERGEPITAALRQAGAVAGRRGAGADLRGIDVYVADTLGEMGLFYRLADIVIMGGGFAVGVGGHNPLEAARLGRGVLTGPNTFNYEDIYSEMAMVGAALVVRDAGELADELAPLLTDPKRRRAFGDTACAYATAQGDAFEAGWRQIAPLLPSP